MNVEIRAARVDDHRDICELLSCPNVVCDTLQLPYVSLDRRREDLDRTTTSLSLRLRAG